MGEGGWGHGYYCDISYSQWTRCTLKSQPLLCSFTRSTPEGDVWIHSSLIPSSDVTTLISHYWMMQYHTLIFQMAPLVAITLPIHPLSGNFQVWTKLTVSECLTSFSWVDHRNLGTSHYILGGDGPSEWGLGYRKYIQWKETPRESVKH